MAAWRVFGEVLGILLAVGAGLAAVVQYVAQRQSEFAHAAFKEKLAVYEEVLKAAGAIAARSWQLTALSNEMTERFLILYYGGMVRVETKAIAKAMESFRQAIMNYTEKVSSESAGMASRRIHKECLLLGLQCRSDLEAVRTKTKFLAESFDSLTLDEIINVKFDPN